MSSATLKRDKRVIRLAAGLLLPGFLGALLWIAITSINALIAGDRITDSGFFPFLLFMSMMAYFFVGIQSLIYSILMEYLINRNVNNNILAVFFSVILGFLLGPILFIILAFFTSGYSIPAGEIGIVTFLSITGAVVGLIVGIILRWLYIKAPISN